MVKQTIQTHNLGTIYTTEDCWYKVQWSSYGGILTITKKTPLATVSVTDCVYEQYLQTVEIFFP